MNTVAEGKIRVLIVDDNLDTRENLEKMLYFEQDIEIVGKAAGGYEGIQKTKDLQPDIVLMDINMPDIDGIRATERVRVDAPGSAVIIMSVQGEQEYMRRAMVAGASDYLVKPFSTDELVGSMHMVYEREGMRQRFLTPPPPISTPIVTVPLPTVEVEQCKVITIFSPKGGVGRTTVAVNLATALKILTNKRVALIDCSLLFGDVGVMLNLVTKKSIADLIPHTSELDDEVVDEIMTAHSSGVKVLLAPPRPEMAELVAVEHVSAILTKLRTMFDFVIIDTMPTLQDIMLAVLDTSDKIVVLATPEISSLKNMKLFMETTEALGYPQAKLMLVVNRVDPHGGIGYSEIEAHVNQKAVCGITNDFKLAVFAANSGIPLVISNKESQIAKDIVNLAEIMSLGEEAKERSNGQSKAKGIAGRFSLFRR